MNTIETEHHPWQPFLPSNAKVLLLGSFPPPRKRWSMDFYYPNITNDFWKITGTIFFDDDTHFVLKEKKGFNRPLIEEFLQDKGIALFDAATAVRRKKGNASDLHLEIVEATDIAALLERIPMCHTIAVTGEKSAETVLMPHGIKPPRIGEYTEITVCSRKIKVFRMPSTSRAYPLPITEKATYYQSLFNAAGIPTP